MVEPALSKGLIGAMPDSLRIGGNAPGTHVGGHKGRLTIITVVKNNLEGLKKTFDSLVRQSSTEFDWLVLDGESTDGTPAWLGALKQERFRFVSRKDRSLFDAMNRSMEMVESGYFLFLNGGDHFWDDSVVARINAAIEERPFEFGYGQIVVGSVPGFPQRIRGAKIKSRLEMFYGKIPCHQASVISKKAFMEMGGYREDLGIYGDREWILRYAKKHHPSTFVFFPFVIVYYDSNGLSYHRFFKWTWTYLKVHFRLGNPLEAIAGILGWLKTALYILSSKTLRDAGETGIGRNGKKANGSH